MNARFVTLVLLLFVWLEGDSVWAQYLPKLYQVFSPDKKLKMAIQRHNDGLLTYTFAANREILIKESPLGFKLESQETVPSSGWKIEKVSDRKVRDEWKPLWGKRAVVEDHFNELVIDLVNPAGQPERMQLVVRGYNDGFAFCYKIPDGEGPRVNVQLSLIHIFSILKLIIIESILITAVFGYLGMILGIGLTEGINSVMEMMNAGKNVSQDDMSIFLNPTVNLSVALSATALIIGAGVLAGYFPARKAVKITAIEAMRNE